MKWEKIGRIIDDSIFDSSYTYTAVPFAEMITEEIIRIYFSSRDSKNRSHTFYVDYDMKRFVLMKSKPELVLSPGKHGSFDDSGAMGSCIIDVGEKKYLYYIGWNLGVTVPFRNSIGLAVSFDAGKSFEKAYNAPIIDRNDVDPYFVASNCVLKDEDKYKLWYLSCTKWELTDNGIKHHYLIKYAESNDGLDWNRAGIIAIDYIDDNEYAISVPRVLKKDGKYNMWFSSRADKFSETYRIRYAESSDGLNWTRFNEAVIDVSKNGWDSEMVCYPFVFNHRGCLYMLYNGNGYGKSGIGLAKMVID